MKLRNLTQGSVWKAITFTFGLVCALIVQLCPKACVALFTKSDVVIVHGTDYLKSYVWNCALDGIHFCYSGFFTACGYSTVSFFHNTVSIVTASLCRCSTCSL